MYLDESWFHDQYDSVVAASQEQGLTLKESSGAVASLYQEAILSGVYERPEIDLYSEGIARFNEYVRPMRSQRKTRLLKTAQYLIDAINDETILGRDDPGLAVSYPLGDQDGTDKTLLSWSVDDWQNATMTRYRKAAEATEKAKSFDALSMQIVSAMHRRGAATVADLLESSRDIELAS